MYDIGTKWCVFTTSCGHLHLVLLMAAYEDSYSNLTSRTLYLSVIPGCALRELEIDCIHYNLANFYERNERGLNA